MAKIIRLDETENGIITVTRLFEPYGVGTKDVLSIGVSLTGNVEEPEWKVHIPLDNVDDVIKALKVLK